MKALDLLKQLPDEEQRALKTAMIILATLDPRLFAHSEHVATLLLRLAPNGSEQCWYFTGLLHDVGKLAMGYEIFRKRGALTQSERQLMQQHPLKGAAVAGDGRTADGRAAQNSITNGGTAEDIRTRSAATIFQSWLARWPWPMRSRR
jgi:HD-GYP domain-containing protein (c-di-GMP phosphodiesterase class II)